MLTLFMALAGACHAFAQAPVPRQITGREDSILQKVYAMGLPVLEINTVGREWPHYYSVDAPEGCFGHSIIAANKVPGRVTLTLGDSVLFDSGEYEEDVSGMTIKIRGNYTARAPKKPYKVKLQKKADMLRRGDSRYNDKNWLLLRTRYLNTDVGLKVSEMVGLDYTPAFEYVNLIFNNEYKGYYLIIEQIRRNTDCRINIKKNGFLFEYDPYWWNESVAVQPSIMEPYIQYTFKYPDSDDITPDDLDRFTTMIRKVEDSMLDDTFTDYIDVTSFAKWMLAHDLMGSSDYRGCNHYLTKYDDSDTTKVKMPCVWDFDLAMRNDGKWFGLHNMFYFRYMFKSPNRAFVDEYVRQYDQLAPTFFDEMDQWLAEKESSEFAPLMTNAIALDSLRWTDPCPSFAESIADARQWFANRKVWMEEKVDSMRQTLIPTGICSKEHADDTPGYSYNLLGQRVHRATKGIIVSRGKKRIVR